MTDKLSETFYGTEATETVEAFWKEISALNLPFKNELAKGDTIERHMVFIFNDGSAQFAFKEDRTPAKLSQGAKDSVLGVFRKHFGGC
ncbi:MAG TPA: hypothetical protein VJY62_08280 [Bacteroidia bacterium]|nr:hypothetical protein [Bacteroidia bacterium]